MSSNRAKLLIASVLMTFALFYMHKSIESELSLFGDRESLNSENIFFIETGDSTRDVTLNARQACAIESAAMTNPNMRVHVLYASRERLKNLTMSPEVAAVLLYPNVMFSHLDVKKLAAGSPLEKLLASDKLSKSKFKLQHTSDVLRLLVLWKYGGTYLDTDVIVRKRIDLKNFACPESADFMNGAVLNFDLLEGRNLIKVFIETLNERFDGDLYSQNGPLLVTSVVKDLCKSFKLVEMKNCQGFHVLKKSDCYPIHYDNWNLLMEDDKANQTMAKLRDSLVVHFWNKLSKNTKIKTNSRAPYIQLARKFCPKVLATRKTFF